MFKLNICREQAAECERAFTFMMDRVFLIPNMKLGAAAAAAVAATVAIVRSTDLTSNNRTIWPAELAESVLVEGEFSSV